MSRVIVSDSFASAIAPSRTEVKAFKDTLATLDSVLTQFATNFISSVKGQPNAQAMRADLKTIQFGFENWWKHVVCKHAEETLRQNFGEKAETPEIEMIDCSVEGDAMKLTFAQDGVTHDEVIQIDQQMVMLTAYDEVTSQDGFQQLKSLCSRIGGLNLVVALNPHRPDSPDLLTAPKTAMIYVDTIDNAPLSQKVDRFEEYGPMH